MRKRWLAASYDKDLAAQIAEEHSLNPIAALLAVIRGLRDNEEIEDFFDPNPFFTLDPFALPDMDKAVERINRAIDNFECIAIFGDFDADGVTSTALLYTYLESKGANVLWYIPDRLTEGYGPTVTIDAACVKGSLLTALQATGNAGRVITMGFSVAPTEVNQFVITSKELDVRGSRLQNRKFQDVIDLVNEGKVDLRGSISHTWNFEDAQAAFDFVDSRDPSYRKGVLTFKK